MAYHRPKPANFWSVPLCVHVVCPVHACSNQCAPPRMLMSIDPPCGPAAAAVAAGMGLPMAAAAPAACRQLHSSRGPRRRDAAQPGGSLSAVVADSLQAREHTGYHGKLSKFVLPEPLRRPLYTLHHHCSTQEAGLRRDASRQRFASSQASDDDTRDERSCILSACEGSMPKKLRGNCPGAVVPPLSPNPSLGVRVSSPHSLFQPAV
jgi:hypothetical protein